MRENRRVIEQSRERLKILGLFMQKLVLKGDSDLLSFPSLWEDHSILEHLALDLVSVSFSR